LADDLTGRNIVLNHDNLREEKASSEQQQANDD